MSPLSKPKLDNLKSPEPLNISYTNIRSLRSNFKELRHTCVSNNKPGLYALCESNLHGAILDTDFLVPGYFPMHCKDSTHVHGLGMYFRDSLPIACDQILEDINEPFMCFRLSLLHSTTHSSFIIHHLAPWWTLCPTI